MGVKRADGYVDRWIKTYVHIKKKWRKKVKKKNMKKEDFFAYLSDWYFVFFLKKTRVLLERSDSELSRKSGSGYLCKSKFCTACLIFGT